MLDEKLIASCIEDMDFSGKCSIVIKRNGTDSINSIVQNIIKKHSKIDTEKYFPIAFKFGVEYVAVLLADKKEIPSDITEIENNPPDLIKMDLNISTSDFLNKYIERFDLFVPIYNNKIG